MTRKEVREKLDAAGYKETRLLHKKDGPFQIIVSVYRNPRGRVEGEGASWAEAYAMFQRSNHR